MLLRTWTLVLVSWIVAHFFFLFLSWTFNLPSRPPHQAHLKKVERQLEPLMCRDFQILAPELFMRMFRGSAQTRTLNSGRALGLWPYRRFWSIVLSNFWVYLKYQVELLTGLEPRSLLVVIDHSSNYNRWHCRRFQRQLDAITKRISRA